MRPPIRLTLNAELQPRSSKHEARFSAAITTLHDELRLLGLDVQITTRESPDLRVIVISAGNLVAPARRQWLAHPVERKRVA